MASCPLCNSKLKIVTKKEDKSLAYIKCEKQKTEKKDDKFVETGDCKFKINFKTKMYSLSKEQMKDLLDNKPITIRDGNILTLDLDSEMFTKIEFVDKYEEEDF